MKKIFQKSIIICIQFIMIFYITNIHTTQYYQTIIFMIHLLFNNLLANQNLRETFGEILSLPTQARELLKQVYTIICVNIFSPLHSIQLRIRANIYKKKCIVNLYIKPSVRNFHLLFVKSSDFYLHLISQLIFVI